MHGSLSVNSSKSSPVFPKIQIFDLSSNYFSGPLPVRYINSFKAIINLEKIGSAESYMGVYDYRSAFYTYSIAIVMKGQDMELVKIFTMWMIIDLSNNQFEGEIPKVIGKLNLLKGLNLSHNNLNGGIPTSIGNLTNLEWLDLSSNRLSGTIPNRLADLPFLSSLNVSGNQLHGQIPQGKQFNTFGNDSYEGNKGLCGFPVSKGCSIIEPAPPNVLEKDGSKSNIAFGWKVVLIGYGCGVVLGMSVGYVVFKTGRPKWLVNLVENQHEKRQRRKSKNVILADPVFLSFLNVSENQLHSQIPQGKQFNTFGNHPYEGNKGLCGFPVSKGCSINDTPPPNVLEQDGSNANIAFGWKVVLIGYGCGVVFGMAMGYVVFQTGSHSCSHHEAASLIQFKNSFSITQTDYAAFYCDDFAGPTSYPKTNSWEEGTDCCSWDGVTCDHLNGHVIALDLSCSWLYGNFPSNSSLFLLPHLEKLNLAFNDFNDSNMPSEFGRFTSLSFLNLSGTRFVGEVPSQVSHLSKLVSLDLSLNFAQTFDKHALQGLVHNLTEVRHIFLDNIDMSSINPHVFMNLSSSLRSLSLAYCGLQGKFPKNFFDLPNLNLLNLGGNQNLNLDPLKFNRSSNLEHLDLSWMSFSTEFIDSVDNLQALKYLDLSGNSFFQGLSVSITNLSSLEQLIILEANICGGLPDSIGNLESLKFLQLSGSNLSGQIQLSILNLT
ncbi:receptor-like protein Cf-9 [Gossypium arboreum]|uniref:receptor-like protein Cf-9 n=1 Tax=Gossypium arboreum TaxID=29729 RepID=UPI0022F18DED|nr:receptor-like protein Cf-9 [Gossypium arboreum]